MGQGSSKPLAPTETKATTETKAPTETKGNTICIDCDKKTQKDLPDDDTTSKAGHPCASFYKDVTDCMVENDGLIAPCSKIWVAFQKCHKEQKQTSR